MYAIRSYYGKAETLILDGRVSVNGIAVKALGTVITSYSIHYTKLYENPSVSGLVPGTVSPAFFSVCLVSSAMVMILYLHSLS